MVPYSEPRPHLDLGGVELLGETGDTGGRPSPSQEPVVAALRLAQAFSLGGGAGITLSGSLEELEGGGTGEVPGEEGSPSLPLNTSFSPERSPSRHRDPVEGRADGVSLPASDQSPSSELAALARVRVLAAGRVSPLVEVLPCCEDSLPVRDRWV